MLVVSVVALIILGLEELLQILTLLELLKVTSLSPHPPYAGNIFTTSPPSGCLDHDRTYLMTVGRKQTPESSSYNLELFLNIVYLKR